MPTVGNYSHAIAIFPENTQGKIEAFEINLKKEKKVGSNFQRNWSLCILIIRYTNLKHQNFQPTLLSFVGNFNRRHGVFLWATATAALNTIVLMGDGEPTASWIPQTEIPTKLTTLKKYLKIPCRASEEPNKGHQPWASQPATTIWRAL